MLLTVVKGQAVSTAKVGNLDGQKLLLVEIVTIADGELARTGRHMVCVDAVGAGEGDLTISVMGSSARFTPGMEEVPTDAVIVGIVDHLHTSGRSIGRDEIPE
jgi:ethanolamine utilization protein EutN